MKFRIVIILLALHSIVLSQGVISGKICDTLNKPIPLSNILLYKSCDSTLVTGVVSDFEGRFELIDIENETYYCIISHISYQEQNITLECLGVDTLLNISLLPLYNSMSQIEVTTKRIESYADKTVYFITSDDKKFHSDGLDLLNILPNINVDNFIQTVSTSSGMSVKIMINGLNADETDLITLKPSEIIRIEHYDIPSAKYAMYSVASVINIITKGSIIGGSGLINLQNSITSVYGNDLISMKYNKKKSQVSFKYNLTYRKNKNRTVDEYLNYSFDSIVFKKSKIGSESPWNYKTNIFSLKYLYHDAKSYSLSIALSGTIYELMNSIVQTNQMTQPIHRYSKSNNVSDNKYFKPVIDIYYMKDFNKRESLSINVVGSHYTTQSYNGYTETDNFGVDTLFNALSNSKGQKNSIIGEVSYSYDLGKVKINSGIWHSSVFASQKLNEYRTENITSNIMNSYAYLEFIGKYHDFSYSVGTGLILNKFNSKELNKSYRTFSLKPIFTLKYSINDNSELKFNYNLSVINPTLSQLNTNVIFQDSLFVLIGNPDLIPYKNHNVSMGYSYSKKRFYLENKLSVNLARNSILPFFKTSNDYIIQTIVNYNSHIKGKYLVYLQYYPFNEKWLMTSFFTQFYYSFNENDDQQWHYFDYISTFSFRINYQKWALNFFYQTRLNRLSGQVLKSIPSVTYIELYRKWSKLSFGLGVRYPFYKSWTRTYNTDFSDIVNRYYTERVFDYSNMIYFNLRYSLDFGKKFEKERNKLFNKDNDSGIFSTD